MKLYLTIIVCTMLLAVVLLTACNKENYSSRDTSGLKPPPPPPPPPPPDPTLVSFNPADAIDNWESAGNKGAIEKTGGKEGAGWLKASIVTGEDYMHLIYKRPAPVDPKLTIDNGQFVFWFYVSSVADLKNNDGQIELTSSNESDKREYAWNLADIIPGLKNGWNEIKLNFSTADVSNDGGPDIHAFNFFRIYLWTANKTHSDVAIGVDDLHFRVKPKTLETFNNADALDNWETAGNKGAIEKPGAKEGQGWLKASIVSGEDYMHFIYKRPAALNAGLTKANGALKMWLYIGDISQIKADGQFELTSSGESDKNEYSWNLATLLPNLKNGWNEITLNFSDAGESSGDGGPKLSAFNFFRLYLWTTGKTHADVALGLDDLRLVEK
ncbi:hypothetical protein [Niastella yeongjuensis]|nr:hypothetical protein [Niastella yeongjuensis]